jgi:hypothetical protein
VILPNAVLAKSARHALSQIYFQTIFMEGDRHIYEKTGLDLQLIANHPVFQLRQSFSPVSLNFKHSFLTTSPSCDQPPKYAF